VNSAGVFLHIVERLLPIIRNFLQVVRQPVHKQTPVPIEAPDIVYSAADDEAIVKFHRDTLATSFHSLGTCAMKPREQGGVVDARLNVYGVEGLKVADLSICPSNVGNNTYSTALLIGEKATVLVAQDLGLNI